MTGFGRGWSITGWKTPQNKNQDQGRMKQYKWKARQPIIQIYPDIRGQITYKIYCWKK